VSIAGDERAGWKRPKYMRRPATPLVVFARSLVNPIRVFCDVSCVMVTSSHAAPESRASRR
jgi:hypothetical protein